jgi:outer membrane protein assembly factor BamB
VAPGYGDRLAVFHAESGETLWHEAVLRREGPMTGPRPAWYTTLSEHASGLLVHGDTIYATTANGGVYAIELRTGQRRWSFATDRPPLLDFQPYHRGRGNILTTPALWRDRLMLGGADGWLYLLAAKDGRLLAEIDFGSPLVAPPVVSGDELFVTTFDGHCHCYRGQHPAG